MALDQTQNFVEVDIVGTYTSTDTTISLESGGASEVPDPANGEYNLVWFDALNNAKPSFDPEVEIVRVTGRDTGNDTLTVQRGRENTSAVAHDTSNADYKFLLTPTSKMISDIDNANFTTNSLTVANTSIALGGTGTPEADNLAGNNGTSGQFLQTDGTNLSFADITGGMTVSERQAFNDLVAQLARNDFADNLSEMAYDGGIFDIFKDESRIASKTNVNVKTLDSGNSNGVVELKSFLDINTASYTNESFTDSGELGNDISGICFNSDGTKMYLLDRNNVTVYQYSLSTAYDVSTASYDNVSLDILGQNDNPYGLFLGDSGTKLFIGQPFNQEFERWDLSNADDLSSASFGQDFEYSDSNNYTGFELKSDGAVLYGLNFEGNTVKQWNLLTAWDLTSASANGTFDVSSEISNDAGGIEISENGGRMWVQEATFDGSTTIIYQYSLSTNYDITTASYDLKSFDASSETDNFSRDFNINEKKSNNNNLHLTDSGSVEEVFQYDVSAIFLSSGFITSITKNLSLSENGGFSSPPSSAVVSQEVTIPTGTEDIIYTLRDGNGNTVTVNQSDVDTEVDVSNFTSTVVEVDVNLSGDGSDTPTSDDYMIHFKE